MIVPDRSLKPHMATRAKCHKVREHIGVVLVVIVASWVYMMNVKFATIGTSTCTAHAANLVSFIDDLSNADPVSSKKLTHTSFPIRAILPGHVAYATAPTTVLSSRLNLTRKRREHLTTTQTGSLCVLLGVLVLADTGTTFPLIAAQRLPTDDTDPSHLLSLPLRVAQSGTEVLAGTACCQSKRSSRKRFSTIITRKYHCFPQCINSARARTVVYLSEVCFELITTLEACFDHC